MITSVVCNVITLAIIYFFRSFNKNTGSKETLKMYIKVHRKKIRNVTNITFKFYITFYNIAKKWDPWNISCNSKSKNYCCYHYMKSFGKERKNELKK